VSRTLFRLPVDMLCDDVIQSGDYPDWDMTFRVMRTLDTDIKIVDELLASVPQKGILEPLLIGVQRWDLVPYLSNGHHRAYVLHQLGLKTFPYRWFWKWRGRPFSLHQCEPEPIPDWILEK
jgi:hypothetical protein